MVHANGTKTWKYTAFCLASLFATFVFRFSHCTCGLIEERWYIDNCHDLCTLLVVAPDVTRRQGVPFGGERKG